MLIGVRCMRHGAPGELNMKTKWPVAIVCLMFALQGCGSTAPGPSGASAHSIAVSTLQKVNAKAHECWLKDADFKAYGIVPELDTSGTPRLLVIPRGKPQSLPQAVIVASTGSAQFYGPLHASPLGPRIQADISRWASGGAGC